MTRMPKPKSAAIASLGVDIGKNTFHPIGLDKRGAIVLRERPSRAQVEVRLANMTPCPIRHLRRRRDFKSCRIQIRRHAASGALRSRADRGGRI
jgi:hypothetical protein